MAHSKITMTNQFGTTKTVPVGFSWTVLFWGFIPPLFRGDWLWALILLVLNGLVGPIASIIVAFFYNKIYIKTLVKRGYRYSSTLKGKSLAQIQAELEQSLV